MVCRNGAEDALLLLKSIKFGVIHNSKSYIILIKQPFERRLN